MKHILNIILLLFAFTTKAQPGKEAWHWNFGYHASLDFSSGTPVVGTCSIDSKDGGASVSDATTGALLFYTDGDTVRDKNNNVMTGGTGFNTYQDYQSTLIIPKPGSSTLYYIIYTYYTNTNPKIYYALVDMTQNGGLGAVTVKNQLIASNAEDKITAIRHCNGTDYWLITHVIASNTFQTYLITAAGISSAPVTSSAGSALSYIGGTAYYSY